MIIRGNIKQTMTLYKTKKRRPPIMFKSTPQIDPRREYTTDTLLSAIETRRISFEKKHICGILPYSMWEVLLQPVWAGIIFS